MVTAYDVPHLDPLPGDPERLAATGARYAGMAEHISAITAQLNALAADENLVSKAADAFRGEARQVASAIDDVLPRYETTAVAVREYAVVLSEAQDQADRAIDAIGTEQHTLIGLYAQRDQIPANPLTREALVPDQTEHLHLLQARIDEHETTLTQLVTTYREAEHTKTLAAAAAAERIIPVLEQLNDTFLDKLGGLVADAGEMLEAVDRWVTTVLEDLLHTMSTVVMAVTLIAVSLVAIVAFALAGAGAGLLHAMSLAPGFDFTDLAHQITMTPDELLNGIVAAGLTITTATNLFMALTLAIEAAKPAPPMVYKGTTDVRKTDLGGATLSDYEQLFLHAGQVDDNGLDAKTQVQIVHAGTKNGHPVWRVVVPSTQDWEEYVGFNDKGAANDLGSNLALILTPDEKAAYERMVLDAMHQAGIQPEDPVMMVGWSQGGILAGKLAADPNSGFNINAIAVAGAPIDHMNIPDDVSVVSLQHDKDPVHHLDGQPAAPPSDNHVTIRTAAYESNSWLPHKSELYASTARALEPAPDPNGGSKLGLVEDGYIDAKTQEKFEEVAKQQAMYFNDDEEVARVYEGAETY